MSEEHAAVAEIKSNPRFFYSYAKKFSKVKSKIGPLKGKNGKYVSDSKEMADILQKQFCTFFSDPNSIAKRNPSFLLYRQVLMTYSWP